jgi:hypothetical protein
MLHVRGRTAAGLVPAASAAPRPPKGATSLQRIPERNRSPLLRLEALTNFSPAARFDIAAPAPQ